MKLTQRNEGFVTCFQLATHVKQLVERHAMGRDGFRINAHMSILIIYIDPGDLQTSAPVCAMHGSCQA